MRIRRFYLLAAIVGTIVPWLFFGGYFAGSQVSTGGVSIAGFVGALFANGAAGGFSADVLISIPVFWVWSWHDARRHSIGRWWLVLPAGCVVGLSLAMPLYFFLRTEPAKP